MNDEKIAAVKKLQSLKNKFCAKLPARIREMERDIALLRGNAWDGEAALRLHMELHKLSGTGASFGFGKVSERAHDVEEYLSALIKSGGAPERSQKKALFTLWDRFTKSFH